MKLRGYCDCLLTHCGCIRRPVSRPFLTFGVDCLTFPTMTSGASIPPFANVRIRHTFIEVLGETPDDWFGGLRPVLRRTNSAPARIDADVFRPAAGVFEVALDINRRELAVSSAGSNVRAGVVGSNLVGSYLSGPRSAVPVARDNQTVEGEYEAESEDESLTRRRTTSDDDEDDEALEFMDVDHDLSKCKPCAFYRFREDGCRQGSDCLYCHVCTYRSLHAKRKREQRQRARARRRKQRADLLR